MRLVDVCEFAVRAQNLALMSFDLLVGNYIIAAFMFVDAGELQSIEVFSDEFRDRHKLVEIFAA